jgi:molybdate transport system substrate-binding protein
MASSIQTLIHRLGIFSARASCGAAIRTLLQWTALVFLLGPADQQAYAQFRDVLVFADQSLEKALIDANNLFLFENGSGVVVTYGTSSALAKQIENGAPADVFIPDNLEAMEYLAERKLIDPDTRENFLGNKLVLVAGADSKTTLTIGPNFPLAQALGQGRLAMPDPASDAAGRYGKAALETLGVWKDIANKVALQQNARATLVSVARGEAPLGLAYQTEAAADKNVRIIAIFPESDPQIIYPITVLASSTNIVAPVFVQYLRSPKGTRFFEKQGFTIY